MEAQPASGHEIPRQPLTETERNWLLALAIVIGGSLLTGLVLLIEKQVTGAPRSERLIWNAEETFMRFLTLPHFLIAILFMTTSRSMQSARSWAWLLGLTALGVGFCMLFAGAGARAAQLPNALFLAYFLIHEFRDQAFFYRVNGDAPTGSDTGQIRRHLLLVPALGLGTILAGFLFGAAFRIGGTRRYTESIYAGASAEVRGALGIAALLLMIGAIHWTRRVWDRTYPGGAPGFIRQHRPIFFVFGGILAVLLLDILINGRAYAIVTLHVAAWFVFVIRGYGKRTAPSPRPRAGGWRWIRTTKSGFLWLHHGLFVLILGVAAVWAYGFQNSGEHEALWMLLSKDAFPYWTIMHVTISFVPR